MSCTVQNIINCGMTIGGINRAWIINFGDIHSYQYQNNNLNYIHNYSLNYIPAELVGCGNDNSFSVSYNNDAANSFNLAIAMTFAPVQQYNRGEFEKLLKGKFSLIVEDKNGRCWLFGETSPMRATTFNLTSGNQGGAENLYRLELTSVSSYQPKEIKCIDSECFSSFQTNEIRQSVFVIENASTYPQSLSLKLVADATILNHTATALLEPTQWAASPTINARDVQTLTDLLGAYPTANTQIELVYDSGSDTAVIAFYSVDTTFPQFQIVPNVPLQAIVSVSLNINFTLGALFTSLNTNITVTDNSSNIVYSGAYGERLTTYNGVTGISNNSYIEVGQLYPNGVTLTLTIDSEGACPPVEFEYTPEPTLTCDETTTQEIYKTNKFKGTFERASNFAEFKTIQFNYNGRIGQLYPLAADWHSSFSQFVTDFTQLVADMNCPISNLVITDLGGLDIQIEFDAPQSNLCFIKTFGNDLADSYTIDTNNRYSSRYFYIRNLTAVNLNSFTTAERISYTTSLGAVAGDNGELYDTNNIAIDVEGLSTGYINDIGIILDELNYNDPIVQDLTSAFCPNIQNDVFVGSCLGSIEKNADLIYQKWEFNYSSVAFTYLTNSFLTFSFDTGADVQVFGNVSIASDFSTFSNSFKTSLPNYSLLGVEFDVARQVWVLELLVQASNTITDITTPATFSATKVDQKQFLKNNLSPLQHPTQPLAWQFATDDPQYALLGGSAFAANGIVKTTDINSIVLTLQYTTVLNISDILTNRNDVEIAFLDLGGAELANYTVNTPLLSDICDIDMLLLVGGYTPTQVKFVRITIDGVSDVYRYDLVANTGLNYSLVYKQKSLSVIGQIQDFYARSLDPNTYTFWYELQAPVVCENFNGEIFDDNNILYRISGLLQNSSDFEESPVVDNVNIVSGQNSISTLSGILQGGEFVRFLGDPQNGWYQVIATRGGNITLAQNLNLPDGDYDMVKATLKQGDCVNFNTPSDVVGLDLPYALWSGFPFASGLSVNKKANTGYKFNSPPTTIGNLAIISIMQPSVDGKTLSYSDTAPIQIEVGVESSGLAETRIYGNAIQSLSGNLSVLGIYTHTFDYNAGNFTFGAGYNGEDLNISSDSGSIPSSTQFTVGASYDGSYSSTFEGQIIEQIVTYDTSLPNIQKWEGYLAWKYGQQILLPNTHPYKTIKP